MNYGFQASNNSGSVTISGENRVMVFSERGTVNVVSANTDRPGYGVITLTKVITTQEPPSLFCRYESGSHQSFTAYFTWLGAPGNWTGFRVTSAVQGGGTLQSQLIEWVVCKFANTAGSEPYGMQVFDAAGKPIYNTSEKIVRYGKFTKSWQLTVLGEFFVDYTPQSISIDLDDFICLSSFDRGVVWFGNQNTQFAGLRFLQNGARTLRIFVQLINSGRILQNPATAGIYFCIPICKFPSNVYSNT